MLGEVSKEDAVLTAELKCGEYESVNHHFFVPVKQIELPQAKIETIVIVEDNIVKITVKSDEIAVYVYLRTKYGGVFSDNGFLLLANEEKQITFEAWTTEKIQDFADCLKVMSLRDSY